jgi:hypothetical protein
MIKFNDYGLLCPSCGGNYLRHDGVFVFNRVEDGKVTTVTTMNGGETTVCQVPSERTSNPSSRRHGIAIRFWCELCAGTAELAIAQHKGCTPCEWRNLSKPASAYRAG